MNTDTLDIIGKYDERISSLGFRLREYLLKELKDISETPDIKANIVGYGYGPGYKAMICAIIPSKKGIKLGFNRGSELPDPAKLLTGSGKVHKYVEINSEKELVLPALKKLLKEAVKAYHQRNSKG
jgi:hypothetical protein